MTPWGSKPTLREEIPLFMVRSTAAVAAISICLAATLLVRTAQAQKHTCTSAEGQRVMDEADRLRTWKALYKSYQLYRHCDDGAIAEGYSESVARILVDHWKTLPELDLLTKADASFRHFVLRHLDATLNTDDVAVVRRRARRECPSGLDSLCKDLAIKADGALQENGIRD